MAKSIPADAEVLALRDFGYFGSQEGDVQGRLLRDQSSYECGPVHVAFDPEGEADGEFVFWCSECGDILGPAVY